MPHFTFITTIRNSIHVTQIEASCVEAALRDAIASLPFDDAEGPFDEELEWLHQFSGGETEVTMHPIGHCRNTWLWLEGARHDPQYLSYAVQTEVTESA